MTRNENAAAGPETPRFGLKPLMAQSFACMMAMAAFTALAGPIGRSLGLPPWQMGGAVTAGGVAWILFARAWGLASDRHGRRPAMLAGLGGFALSHAGLCLFVAQALAGGMSPPLAFAGLVAWRALAGAFYAAVPTVGTALIADHVAPERRAAAMAMVGMASGAGMVIGPALIALAAPYGLVWPLGAIAVPPLVAVLVLWRGLPGSAALRLDDPPPPPRWTDPRLRRPVAVAFVAMFSVATAQIVVGFYAIDRFGLSPGQGAEVAGLALTCVGGALILAQISLRAVAAPPERLIRLGAAIAAAGFCAAIFATSPALLCGCYFIAAAGMGLIWPSVSALAANAVERGEQGAAAGTVAAAQGMGGILGPLLGSAIYALDSAAPFVLIALLLVLIPVAFRRAPRPG